MKCRKWDIGVCSWSLKTEIDNVARTMKEIGIDHVHLEIGPALEEGGRNYLSFARQQDWIISSTMIAFPQEDYSTLNTIKITGGVVPDDNWSANKQLFSNAANTTKELGVEYLSMHAGFIDHTEPQKYEIVHGRIKCLGDIAAENGIMLLMETGQETAEEMADFLNDLNHSAVGINFDPANMILYDRGDPIEAVKVLGPWIKHVHIKDATRTETPGTWGLEVPWGAGEVGQTTFLKTLSKVGFDGVLAIEREAGTERIKDIQQAVNSLQGFEG